MNIVNHSNLDPRWRWFDGVISNADINWHHHSQFDYPTLNRIRKVGAIAARVLAAKSALSDLANDGANVIVSHGPRPALYLETMANIRNKHNFRHIVFSFNFTKLPVGNERTIYARTLKNVDRFVVYSTMEKKLYSEYFDLDPMKIDMVYWGVKTIDPATLPPQEIKGGYVSAVGSQGRDYSVLLDAARLLPNIPFHIVVHKDSIAGLSIPSNVTVHINVPLDVARGIVAKSSIMALPLLNGEVPCGHVTAVMGLQFAIPIVATDSIGIHDYLIEGQTAYLVPPKDATAFAVKLKSVWENPGDAYATASRGSDFALKNCLEEHTVAYFEHYLASFA